jgi:hypothetical protein
LARTERSEGLVSFTDFTFDVGSIGADIGTSVGQDIGTDVGIDTGVPSLDEREAADANPALRERQAGPRIAKLSLANEERIDQCWPTEQSIATKLVGLSIGTRLPNHPPPDLNDHPMTKRVTAPAR